MPTRSVWCPSPIFSQPVVEFSCSSETFLNLIQGFFNLGRDVICPCSCFKYPRASQGFIQPSKVASIKAQAQTSYDQKRDSCDQLKGFCCPSQGFIYPIKGIFALNVGILRPPKQGLHLPQMTDSRWQWFIFHHTWGSVYLRKSPA